MRRPLGLKEALQTTSSWNSGLPICIPVSASQTRAVWSADAVTMRRPFELKQALQRCPNDGGVRLSVYRFRHPRSELYGQPMP